MAKKGKKNSRLAADVVSHYFPEDDGVLLILADKNIMVELDDLSGEYLDKAIKELKKPNVNKINLISATTSVILSKELKRKLIAHLEALKEMREEK